MNLTLTIDDELLRRARIRALEQGTSVNQVVREFLESYAGTGEERRARERLLQRAGSSEASSGPAGRSWTRAALYQERTGATDEGGTAVHEP